MAIIGTFGNDLLIGTSGADSIIGSFGNDSLQGLGDNDVLSGGGDNDTLDGGAGNDDLHGDAGIDTMLFNTGGNVTVSAAFGVASSPGLGVDHFYSVENVTTGSGNDQIFFSSDANIINTANGSDTVYAYDGDDVVNGGNQADELHGGDGIDTLNGGSGNDTLDGGDGDDAVYGDAGNDTIHAGAGSDHYSGGEGSDTIVYTTSGAVDFSDEDGLASYWDGSDWQTASIASIENVVTGGGDDLIYFSATEDKNSVVDTNGGNDDVTLYGGNDTADLGAGDDEANGGLGNDTLNGGTGIDVLTGAGGADDFVFDEDDSGVGAGNRDEITDFSQGQDDIDLSGFNYLDFIGHSFDAPNQVRFLHSGGDTIVRINTVGNTGVEMEIELDGIVNLGMGDFIF